MRAMMIGMVATAVVVLSGPAMQASELSSRRELNRSDCEQTESNGQDRERTREQTRERTREQTREQTRERTRERQHAQRR